MLLHLWTEDYDAQKLLVIKDEDDDPVIITQRPRPKRALNTAVLLQSRTLVTSSRCGPIE